MTDDRMQGHWDEAKGKVKEDIGKVSGDRSTEMSGKFDQAKGKVEHAVGDARDAMRDNQRTR